jgi:thymidylate synthase ThyX
MENGIEVTPILATRPALGVERGLITFRVRVPSYIWTEILTHKRLARNASSARAQTSQRHIEMGYYQPQIFYQQGKGMEAGDPVDPQTQAAVEALWKGAWSAASFYVARLAELGIAKEQANRLLPPIKMVDGIITGTEDAWAAFLSLRLDSAADTAMQRFARSVAAVLPRLRWDYGLTHYPMVGGGEPVIVGAARIARVSYTGKSRGDDEALAERLLKDRHLSPFEHLARFVLNPRPSALASKDGDYVTNPRGQRWGWENYRAHIESEEIAHGTL